MKTDSYKGIIATIFIMAMILFMPFVMASGEVKEFDKDKGLKGEITIKDNYGIPFFSSKKAVYTITSWTDQCLIDCSGEFLVNVYQSDKLFTGLKFYDKKAIEKSKQFNLFINDTETYQEPIYTDNCSMQTTINGTQYESCIKYQSGIETKTREIMKPYNFETVSAGSYKLKLETKKEIFESIDAVPVAYGMELSEYAWFNSSWGYKNNYTINSTVSSTLTNYPAYITMDTATLITAGKMNSSCKDIRVLDSTDTTQYSYEIENGTCNTSSTVVWFKYPSLATGNQTVNIYYGNQLASDGQNSASVWSDYVLVLHFGEIAGNYIDSSNTTITGCERTSTTVATDGKFGKSVALANSFIKCAETGIIGKWNVTTNFSISGWIKPYTTNYIPLLSKGKQTGQIAYEIRRDVTSKIATFYSVDGGQFSSVATIENATLTYLGARHGSGDAILVSTTKATGSLASPTYTTSNPLCIGAQSYSGTCTKLGDYGTIDEVRLTNISRSDDWLKAENLQTQFIGTEILVGGVTTTLVTPVDVTNSSSSSITFNCSATSVGETQITNITLYVWNGGLITNTTSLTGQYNSTTWTNIKPDGNYIWNCLTGSSDTALTFATTNRTLTVDTTAPVVSILSPTSNQNLVIPPDNFTLNYSSIDAGNHRSSCWYSYNGGANTTITSCNNLSLAINTIGNQTIRVWSNDTFGNLGTAIQSFFVSPTLAVCNGTFTQKAINFTTYDVTSLLVVNNSFMLGTFFSYLPSHPSLVTNLSFNIVNDADGSFPFCIYPTWANTTYNLVSTYGQTSYGTQAYNVLAGTLTNSTQNVSLYMLNNSALTWLIVTLVDSNLIPQQNYSVIIQQFYPSTNSWTQVGTDTTSDLGQVIFPIVENTVNYRFIFSKNGSVVYQTNTMKIACLTTPCQISLALPSTSTNLFTNYQNTGINYYLNYSNATKVITYNFVDTSATATSFRLQVINTNLTSNNVVCDTTTTASSGTITCDLTGNTTGTYFAQAYYTKSGVTQVIDRLTVTLDNNIATFGKEGLFWAILFLLTVAMVGIWNPVASIGMLIVGLIGLFMFGFVAMPWALLVGIIIIGGVFISQMKT